MFGESNAPDNLFFKTFKAQWPSVDKDVFETLDLTDSSVWLQQQRDDALSFMRTVLSRPKEYLPRNDYRELAELTMIVLGETPPRGVHISCPGAHHKARWMATIIYAMKMFMYGPQLNYEADDWGKLRSLVTFFAIFYSPYWFSCTRAIEAPANDFRFIHTMSLLMVNGDQEVAKLVEAAKKKLKSHGWYLTEENVVFSLFNEKISDSVRADIAKALMEAPQVGDRVGKPKFPKVEDDTQLKNLVGPQSRFIFNRVGIRVDWLSLAVSDWANQPSYQETLKFLKGLKVTNDVSE